MPAVFLSAWRVSSSAAVTKQAVVITIPTPCSPVHYIYSPDNKNNCMGPEGTSSAGSLCCRCWQLYSPRILLWSEQGYRRICPCAQLTTTPWRRVGEWRYSSNILHLGTKWRRVASFTPRPFYPRGNGPRYPLDRRLGGPKSRSGRCGVEKDLLPLPGIEPRSFSTQPVATPTELSRLPTIR
jgi:hypothetical protein